MRSRRLLVPALALLLAVPAVSFTATKKSFNFFLGQKTIHDLEDTDLDKQIDVGVEMSFGQEKWPVMIAVDVLTSWEDDESTQFGFGYAYTLNSDSLNIELDGGIRKTWEPAKYRVRPYVGGGLGIIRSELSASVRGNVLSASANEDDIGYGPWAGGGIYWKLSQKLNLGFDARYSKMDVDIGSENLNMGGFHVGALFGWGF